MCKKKGKPQKYIRKYIKQLDLDKNKKDLLKKQSQELLRKSQKQGVFSPGKGPACKAAACLMIEMQNCFDESIENKFSVFNKLEEPSVNRRIEEINDYFNLEEKI